LINKILGVVKINFEFEAVYINLSKIIRIYVDRAIADDSALITDAFRKVV